MLDAMAISGEERQDSLKDAVAKADETLAPEKISFENVESGAPATYADTVAARLSKAHQDYLIQRHGTLDLNPVPGMGPADPYNWPTWKKTFNLVLVAFHSCMASLTAAAIIPAYADIAKEFNLSLNQTSYLTSLQIAVLGGAPLFWRPLANRYGRCPIFLLSLICSLICNVGCAKSNSWASIAACRALVSFFMSPPASIGTAVVTETFFKKERARYIGIWTVMITLGVPVGPLIFGFVAYRVGFRWMYWVLAITNGVQFILYLFFGPETLYRGSDAESQESNWKAEYLSIRRIDPTPLSLYEFVQPLTLAARPSVMIPAAAHAMAFVFCSVLTTVEVPQLLQEKFGLNAEQLGLQFLGLIIGSLLGEQLGGALSDTWMNRRARSTGQKPQPEYRLWLSYLGSALAIVGIIVFLVCTQEAKTGHWSVAPIVGTGIAAFGNQVVTTVMFTYAVDCYTTESASIGVFVTFVRQIWGFIGPFWFSPMFEDVGIAASSGVTSALMVGVSVIPVILIQWKGQAWRQKRGE